MNAKQGSMRRCHTFTKTYFVSSASCFKIKCYCSMQYTVMLWRQISVRAFTHEVLLFFFWCVSGRVQRNTPLVHPRLRGPVAWWSRDSLPGGHLKVANEMKPRALSTCGNNTVTKLHYIFLKLALPEIWDHHCIQKSFMYENRCFFPISQPYS